MTEFNKWFQHLQMSSVLSQSECGAFDLRANYPDLLTTLGKYQEKPPFPFTPGMEVDWPIMGSVMPCDSNNGY